MAYTTINKSSDYFSTDLWSGNSSTQSINVGKNFSSNGSLIWIKGRNSSGFAHRFIDSVRGKEKLLASNSTDAEFTESGDGIASYSSTGFNLQFSSQNDYNESGGNYVGWNWLAGSTTGSGTTTGTGTGKAYSYSVNTTAGFSIVTYKGNGSAGQQIPHHLGVVPQCIILKPMDRADNWRVYHVGTDNSSPGNYQLKLNSTNARDSGSDVWNNTIPTSTYFTLGSNAGVGANDEDFIAYCFTNKTGYSRCGSYEGNGESDGTFVYTGFRPSFVLIKGTISGDGNAAQNWELYDDKRLGYNSSNSTLYPNLSNAESAGTRIDLYSNGFRAVTNSDGVNDDESRYVYMAFGQSLVGSNNVPCTAR